MLRLVAGLLSAICMLAPGAALANAGYVHDMTGTATVTPRGGAAQPLRTGDIVAAGSTVTTAAGSTAVVKFEDGQIAALQAGTAFRIDQFNYNKQKVSESSASFNLIRGGLRFITGVIGSTNRNAVRLTVGNATIGIRGTDVVVFNDPVTQAVLANVLAGFIALTNPQGTQTVSVGNASVALGNNAPTTPVPASAAPLPPATLAAARAAIATLTAATVNIPVNTPVVLAASATAARLLAQSRANPANTALAAQAQAALTNAIEAGQAAFADAVKAGAVPPAPPAPPAPPPGTTAPTPAAAAAATATEILTVPPPPPPPLIITPPPTGGSGTLPACAPGTTSTAALPCIPIPTGAAAPTVTLPACAPGTTSTAALPCIPVTTTTTTPTTGTASPN